MLSSHLFNINDRDPKEALFEKKCPPRSRLRSATESRT